MGQALNIENFREHFETIYDFCKAAVAAEPTQYNQRNLGVIYWASNPSSLLYKIYISNTIKLVTIIDNIHISAVGHLNKNTAIVGKRHFLMPQYRMKVKPSLLDQAMTIQIKWCKTSGYKTVITTYNEDHIQLVQFHRRLISGKGIPGYSIGDSFLKKFIEYPELVEINGYRQHVFYYQFDKRYKLDFYKRG